MKGNNKVMNTKISFEYEGKNYVLEYNRKSIENMERLGFSVSEFQDKPMLMLPLAFKGLFFKNHKYEKQNTIDAIFDKFNKKSELIDTIATMLNETYSSLTDNTEENEGNIDWKIV